MSFKERLKRARQSTNPRLTQAEVASRLGVTPQAVSGWERGEALPTTEKLNDLSSLLGVNLAFLLDDEKIQEQPSNVQDMVPPTVGISTRDNRLVTVAGEGLRGAYDLPVFSIAQGGEGALILANEPFTHIARPHKLQGISGSYGVLVIGHSMAREYNEGDIAYVNPHLHPKKGDPCVFQGRASDGTMKAIIKYLERSPDASETLYYVSESWPEVRKFTIRKADWQVCHVAVGKESGR